MSLTFNSAAVTSTGFNTGGRFNVGLSRNLGLSGGKPFQPGYNGFSSTPMLSGKANKPMIPGNYRVVYPFNVAEYKEPGRNWHKNLEAQYSFIVRGVEAEAVQKFSKSLAPAQPLQKRQTVGKVGIDPVTPIRTLPALNFGLMLDCYNVDDIKKLNVRALVKRITALGISHTQENTTLPYPVGSHVTNFTMAGEVDCYNIFSKNLRELQHLYFILKPVKYDFSKHNTEFRFEESEDKRSFASLCGAKGEALGDKKYKWVVVPYASEDDLPPSISEYEISFKEPDAVCGKDINKYITGTYWRIGIVKEIILTEVTRKGKDYHSTFHLESCLTDYLSIINQPKIRILVDPMHPPHA